MQDKSRAPAGKLQDFHEQLEMLLRRQLDEQPHLDDVRLKLLELYFEQRRAQDFIKFAHTFKKRIPDLAASREWQRVASMGRMLAPGDDMFETERIEFIDSHIAAPAAGKPQKAARFGAEDRYRELFDQLARDYEPVRADPRFLAELELLLINLPTRRPTPLVHARRLSAETGGAQIYLKREDLADENPHLTVAIVGQALLAQRLGRKVLVTGTADGRRGVIAAAVAARLGLHARVFMDAKKAEVATANVLYLGLFGAELQRVKVSEYRNGDIREAALQDWADHPDECFLLTGLDAAPPPYPAMTQEFIANIGRETRRQITAAAKGLPAALVTRGTGSADALGLFPAFVGDAEISLMCVEPQAEGAATHKGDDLFNQGGMLSTRETKVARSILDKLEYPSVAREHALLRASGRVDYIETTRAAARGALQALARTEGVLVPLETAHALACAIDLSRGLKATQSVVLMVSERIGNQAWDLQRLVDGAQQ